jgi:hypothetical protein
MRVAAITAALLLMVLFNGVLLASYPVGVYSLVERVIFEPNEQSPQRIQVWGAFSFIDAAGSNAATTPHRGYLYFSMPSSVSGSEAETIRKEWADLKAVAGTGQAVAFGSWRYNGPLDENTRIYGRFRMEGNSVAFDVVVHPQSAGSPQPIPYATNAGIVKLPAAGNHAPVVRQLQEALRQ